MTDKDRISYVNGFIEGAKLQGERSYSEEDVKNIIQIVFELTNKGYSIDEIFEQFKKPNTWYNEEQTNKRMNVIGQNGNDGTHYETK